MGDSQDSDASAKSNSKYRALVLIAGVIIFVAALGTQFYALRVQSPELAQLAGVAQVFVVIAAVIGFALFHPSKKPTDDHTKKSLRDEWLLRLVVVTGLGLCVVVIYTLEWIQRDILPIVGSGLLTSGATWLAAVVIGFLFGVPHTSDSSPGTSQYKPSTSLEQVADWLTKIIVGLGLTQLNKIPGKVAALASYIAAGMGDTPSSKLMALAIFIYFSSCGFLFGFLWARLYMLEEYNIAQQTLQSMIKGVIARADIRELIKGSNEGLTRGPGGSGPGV